MLLTTVQYRDTPTVKTMDFPVKQIIYKKKKEKRKDTIMPNNNKIIVDINDRFQLVAALNDWDPNAKELAEISVFLQEKTTGLIHQDLAVIGRNYRMTDNGPELYDDLSVKVYADANNEDFTDDFTIPIYEESEED